MIAAPRDSRKIVTLEKWLKDHNLSAAWMAGKIGASKAALSKWLNRKSLPSAQFIARIEDFTDGAVGAMDWWMHWIEAHPEDARGWESGSVRSK